MKAPISKLAKEIGLDKIAKTIVAKDKYLIHNKKRYKVTKIK